MIQTKVTDNYKQTLRTLGFEKTKRSTISTYSHLTIFSSITLQKDVEAKRSQYKQNHLYFNNIK